MMKAYIISTDYGDFSTVVFAENRNKAKSVGMHTDACMDADYVDIRARRCPALDKYYNNRIEMDWMDDNDRIAMVKDGNFVCDYDTYYDSDECPTCPARAWCDRYNDLENEK